MLTHTQLLYLFPQNAVDLCKTRPKRCLFGSPDPVENRILLEEQFAMDKERIWQRYAFDIATGRPVTSIGSSENEEKAGTETVAETGSHDRQNSCPVPAATNEEVENHCIPESEVRNRSGRYSPYSRQKKITDYFKSRRSTDATTMEKTAAVPISESQKCTISVKVSNCNS